MSKDNTMTIASSVAVVGLLVEAGAAVNSNDSTMTIAAIGPLVEAVYLNFIWKLYK